MERQGPPRLLGSSSSNVLWSYHTPPGRRLRCPIVATTLLPSGNPAPWAIPERYLISGPPIPRPTRSLPYCFARPVTGTHARARFRPAGLSVGRVGFAPTGRLTVFQEGITSFYSNGPALPGRVQIDNAMLGPTRSADPAHDCDETPRGLAQSTRNAGGDTDGAVPAAGCLGQHQSLNRRPTRSAHHLRGQGLTSRFVDLIDIKTSWNLAEAGGIGVQIGQNEFVRNTVSDSLQITAQLIVN